MVTVFLGVWGGNWIVTNHQTYDKEHQQQLLAAQNAYQILGEVHFHSNAILKLKLLEMQPKAHSTAAIQLLVQKRRDRISDDFDKFMQRWETQKYTIAMQIGYFRDDAIRKAWDDAKDKSETMLNQALLFSMPGRPIDEKKVDQDEARFNQAVANLSDAVDKAVKKQRRTFFGVAW